MAFVRKTLRALCEGTGKCALVRGLVERHHVETGSAVAARLLADWDTAVPRFGKVMPKDYKRVLDAASRAELEGRDVNEAVMAAAHG